MGKFLLISLCVVVVASSVMAEPQIIQMGQHCPLWWDGTPLANHYTETFGLYNPDDSLGILRFTLEAVVDNMTITSAEAQWLNGLDSTFFTGDVFAYGYSGDSTYTVIVDIGNLTYRFLPSPDTIPLFEVLLECGGSEDYQIGSVRFDSTDHWEQYAFPWEFAPPWGIAPPFGLAGSLHAIGEEEIKYFPSPDTLISLFAEGRPYECYACEEFQFQLDASSPFRDANFGYWVSEYNMTPFEIDQETGIVTVQPTSDSETPFLWFLCSVGTSFCDGDFHTSLYSSLSVEIPKSLYWDTCPCGILPEFVNGQPNRFVAEDVDTLAIPLQLEDYSNMPSWFSHWTSTQDPVVPGHMDSTGTFYFHPGPGDTATYWVYATLGCGTQYRDTIGFYIYNWHNYTCGDVNHSYDIDISDLTWLVSYLFQNGIQPTPMRAGDLTCDDNVDVSDLTRLVNYLFLEGPPPPENCE